MKKQNFHKSTCALKDCFGCMPEPPKWSIVPWSHSRREALNAIDPEWESKINIIGKVKYWVNEWQGAGCWHDDEITDSDIPDTK